MSEEITRSRECLRPATGPKIAQNVSHAPKRVRTAPINPVVSSFPLFFSPRPFHQTFKYSCLESLVIAVYSFVFISLVFQHVGLLRSQSLALFTWSRVRSYHISRSACFTGPPVLNRTFTTPRCHFLPRRTIRQHCIEHDTPR